MSGGVTVSWHKLAIQWITLFFLPQKWILWQKKTACDVSIGTIVSVAVSRMASRLVHLYLDQYLAACTQPSALGGSKVVT